MPKPISLKMSPLLPDMPAGNNIRPATNGRSGRLHCSMPTRIAGIPSGIPQSESSLNVYLDPTTATLGADRVIPEAGARPSCRGDKAEEASSCREGKKAAE